MPESSETWLVQFVDSLEVVPIFVKPESSETWLVQFVDSLEVVPIFVKP